MKNLCSKVRIYMPTPKPYVYHPNLRALYPYVHNDELYISVSGLNASEKC